MSDKNGGIFGNLSGSRFLAKLYAKDAEQASFMQKIINAVNTVAKNAAVGPIAEVPPPPPIDNINIKTAGEFMHVTLNHNRPVNKGINYFVEVANEPAFKAPIVHQIGASRAAPPIQLPTLDDDGNTQPYYVRAYAQYPGSKPSKVNTFGGALTASPITMGGTTKMTLLPSTGSGTASPTGQQGASGFGKNIVSNKVIGVQASISTAGNQGGQGPVITPPAPPSVTIFGDTLKDHFYFGSATATNAGELAWRLNTDDDRLTNGIYGGGPLPHIGAVGLLPALSTNLAAYIIPGQIFNSQTSSTENPAYFGGMVPFFDYPSWHFIWTFQLARYPTRRTTVSPFPLPNASLYIGLRSWSDSNPTVRPNQFVGLRFDTDTTAPAISDTTFHFEGVANDNAQGFTINNTQGNVFDTGVVPTEFVWYTFEMEMQTAGSILMTLTGGDGSSAVSTIAAPIYKYGANASHSSTRTNNILQVTLSPTASSSAYIPWGIGSQVTYTNFISGSISINVTRPLLDTNDVSTSFLDTGINLGVQPQAALEVTGYPAMYPFAQFGNTSQAAPVQDHIMYVDYFEYNQIPGIAGT